MYACIDKCLFVARGLNYYAMAIRSLRSNYHTIPTVSELQTLTSSKFPPRSA